MKQRRRVALSCCLFSGLTNQRVTRTKFDPFQNSVIFLMTHKPIFRTQQGLSTFCLSLSKSLRLLLRQLG